MNLKTPTICLFIFLMLVTQHSFACVLSRSPTIIIDNGDKLAQYWEVEDTPDLWDGQPSNVPELINFRKQVAKLVDVDQTAILTHQMQYVTQGNLKNSKLIRDGDVGQIRKINCIESLLFEYQAQRSPMLEKPSEFLAYFLVRDRPQGKNIRILYYTINQPGIGSLSVSHANLRKFVTEGWKVKMSLHNHNFDMTKPNYLGGVAPSSSDVQAYLGEKLEFQLEFALITNGFDTSVIRSSEFAILSTEN